MLADPVALSSQEQKNAPNLAAALAASCSMDRRSSGVATQFKTLNITTLRPCLVSEGKKFRDTVAFSFVCSNYCLTID